MNTQKLTNRIPELLAVFFTIQIAYWSVTREDTPWSFFKEGSITLAFWIIGYRVFDVHRRFGFFGVSEPDAHFIFQLKNVWVVLSWLMTTYWTSVLLGVKPEPIWYYAEKLDWMRWSFPEWMTLEHETPFQKYAVAVIVFYTIDFCRYWTHRIGHMQFFYRTFPFAHAQHHNQVFLHPWSFAYQPFFHTTLWATLVPSIIFWGFGFKQATLLGNAVSLFPNLNQHLGFDPLPWVTKLNHYYFYGALPWLPLYHQYHHLPYTKRGNYGNITMLWDYLFQTLIPDSIEHIETGKMPERILERFRDPKKLEAEFAGKLKNRNKLDYNSSMDPSIFSLRYI